MADNVFDVTAFKKTKKMEACRKVTADPWWGRTCAEQKTNLICALVMASAVLTVADKSSDLDRKCITVYIYNNAAKCGLIKSDSKFPILAILSRISWAILAYRNITPCLGRVDSDMNISDLATCVLELPYRILSDSDFRAV